MSIRTFLRNSLAATLPPLLRWLACDPKYFYAWQARGIHVLPVHYYSPVPDTDALDESVFSRPTAMPGVRVDSENQLKLLRRFVSDYGAETAAFATDAPSDSTRYHFRNEAFGPVDAEVLYCMVRDSKPRRVIEIGSGFSTLLIVQALAANRQGGSLGELTAIEPYPREFLHAAITGTGSLVVQPVQSVPLEQFTSLSANDILFIDSSHVCRIGSDVQYEFLEILPRLQPGVIVHIHDIFLPEEYPASWVREHRRFWNEQYVLQAFLCGSGNWEILWAANYMRLAHFEELALAFPSFPSLGSGPCSFWMRKVN